MELLVNKWLTHWLNRHLMSKYVFNFYRKLKPIITLFYFLTLVDIEILRYVPETKGFNKLSQFYGKHIIVFIY